MNLPTIAVGLVIAPTAKRDVIIAMLVSFILKNQKEK